jgi:hypothetical protein
MRWKEKLKNTERNLQASTIIHIASIHLLQGNKLNSRYMSWEYFIISAKPHWLYNLGLIFDICNILVKHVHTEKLRSTALPPVNLSHFPTIVYHNTPHSCKPARDTFSSISRWQPKISKSYVLVCIPPLLVGMKTDRIRTDITDIVFVFIFMSGFGFEYG